MTVYTQHFRARNGVQTGEFREKPTSWNQDELMGKHKSSRQTKSISGLDWNRRVAEFSRLDERHRVESRAVPCGKSSRWGSRSIGWFLKSSANIDMKILQLPRNRERKRKKSVFRRQINLAQCEAIGGSKTTKRREKLRFWYNVRSSFHSACWFNYGLTLSSRRMPKKHLASFPFFLRSSWAQEVKICCTLASCSDYIVTFLSFFFWLSSLRTS